MRNAINFTAKHVKPLEPCSDIAIIKTKDVVRRTLYAYVLELNKLLSQAAIHTRVNFKTVENFQHFGDDSLVDAIAKVAPTNYQFGELIFSYFCYKPNKWCAVEH